ncbi:MAG: leucine-rich repeat domain-containing protein [Promethearchaeota archaeon]
MLLFKNSKKVSFQVIRNELELPINFNNWNELLNVFKKQEYFEIDNDGIVRNNNKTNYEKIKYALKISGKYILKCSIPVAISLLSGGTGLSVALNPLISQLKEYFNKFKIKVPDSLGNDITDLIKNAKFDLIEELINKIFDENKAEFRLSKTQLEEIRINIKLEIQEILEPFIFELETILKHLLRIENKQQYFLDILDDWMIDQQLKIDELSKTSYKINDNLVQILNKYADEFIPAIEKIESTLIEQKHGINKKLDEIMEFVININKNLERNFREICQEGLLEYSLDDLIKVSEIQFQNVRLHGKFEENPYDPNFFVNDTELEQHFNKFILSTSKYSIYLILAHMGMGKTWNSIHLGIWAREHKKAIPFFIPVYKGYEEILKSIFGKINSTEIGNICEEIFIRTHKQILLIFDGLDEISKSNRNNLMNLIRDLSIYKNYLKIIITTRLYDWIFTQEIVYQQNFIKDYIFPNEKFKELEQKFKIQTHISWYISEFSNKQLKLVLQKYKLNEELIPKGLLELCKIPFILEIVYKRQCFPDPDNIEEFMKIFYNRETPENGITILSRMGIIGDVETLFIEILKHFKDSNDKISYKEVKEIIDSKKEEWHVLLLSSLFIIEKKETDYYYSFNPYFRPFIEYLIKKYDETLFEKYNETNLYLADYKGLKYLHEKLNEPLQKIKEENIPDTFNIKDFKAKSYFIEKNKHVAGLILYKKDLTEKDLEYPLKKLKYIEILNLASNKLSSIPEKVCYMKNLKKLDLFNNRISTIPKCIKSLKSLEYLNLGFNKISFIDEFFPSLKYIKYLNLSGNELKKLPNNFGELDSIVYLNLGKNKLTNLPNSIGNIHYLKYLNISYNKLTNLPKTITNLINIKELNFAMNDIKNLNSKIIKYLKKLNEHGAKIFSDINIS